jgi:hypothetical protein
MTRRSVLVDTIIKPAGTRAGHFRSSPTDAYGIAALAPVWAHTGSVVAVDLALFIPDPLHRLLLVGIVARIPKLVVQSGRRVLNLLERPVIDSLG